MQQNSQQETIDDKLFVPLSEFFVDDNPDFGEFERFILSKGYPDYSQKGSRKTSPEEVVNQYRGFLFDAYVKWSLSRFTKETNKPFGPSNHKYGLTPDEKHLFIMNKWGNVHFYNFETGGKEAELDALWEFQDDLTIPINFEITLGRSRGRQHIELHRDLITQFYNASSHYCRIRPTNGEEELGLSIIKDYRRKIVIPQISNLDTLAMDITNTNYQNKEYKSNQKL